MQKHLSNYQWTILTLEPRFYAWRIRGNSLSWAYEKKEQLNEDYDLLIACSLTDLSALRGFVPKIASLPTIVYCHENQFFYPENKESSGKRGNPIEQQIIQIYNFECANKLVFNSEFNRQSCLEGIKKLLKKLPDHVPKKLLENIEKKTRILPVPLDKAPLIIEETKTLGKDKEVFSIVWNHRWEYDKGLSQLEKIVDMLIEKKLPCKIHLLGQQFRTIPDTLKSIVEKLKENKLAGNIGFIESRREYFNVLKSSHIILSTSLHEFQGLAVMEAAQAACVPVLPKRLSYCEFFPEQFLYESNLENSEKESRAAFEMLNTRYKEWQKEKLPERQALIVNLPDWENKKAFYQELIESF
jgi:glycosyltransferase involved in cell wall biosynthesis